MNQFTLNFFLLFICTVLVAFPLSGYEPIDPQHDIEGKAMPVQQLQEKDFPGIFVLPGKKIEERAGPNIRTVVPKTLSDQPPERQTALKQFSEGPLLSLAQAVDQGKWTPQASKAVQENAIALFGNRESLPFVKFSNIANPENIQVLKTFEAAALDVRLTENQMNTLLHPQGMRVVASVRGDPDKKETWSVQFTMFEISDRQDLKTEVLPERVPVYFLKVANGFSDNSNSNATYITGTSFIFLGLPEF